MKTLAILCVVFAVSMFGQPVPSSGTLYLDANGNVILDSHGHPSQSEEGSPYRVHYRYSYEAGVKTLNYRTEDCSPPIPLDLIFQGIPRGECIPAAVAHLEDFSGIQYLENLLIIWANDAPFQIIYNNSKTVNISNGSNSPTFDPLEARPASRGALATIQPVPPLSRSMIVLDGLSGNLVQMDLTTGNVLGQVALPAQARAIAVRPMVTGPSSEVWTAHGGTVNELSISNVSTKSVTATIPTSSLDPNNIVPVGIVFTNDGLIALYAISYYTPDVAGNHGALLVFDTVARKLVYTLLLKNGPTALVMSPDALTAFLLSDNGQITYYDVLSGTADLTASTFTPGKNNGYNGASNVFVHPDGTRLFWTVGPFLESFDLTTRKVTAQFDSGLPTTSGITLEVSQDGSVATMSNGQGAIIILETQYGLLQASLQRTGSSILFPGY